MSLATPNQPTSNITHHTCKMQDCRHEAQMAARQACDASVHTHTHTLALSLSLSLCLSGARYLPVVCAVCCVPCVVLCVSCLVLSCVVCGLSCLVLSCPVLSCLVLSCPYLGSEEVSMGVGRNRVQESELIEVLARLRSTHLIHAVAVLIVDGHPASEDRQKTENAFILRFVLSLSRACHGKLIVYSVQMVRNGRLPHRAPMLGVQPDKSSRYFVCEKPRRHHHFGVELSSLLSRVCLDKSSSGNDHKTKKRKGERRGRKEQSGAFSLSLSLSLLPARQTCRGIRPSAQRSASPAPPRRCCPSTCPRTPTRSDGSQSPVRK
jgi:hypothetical protein